MEKPDIKIHTWSEIVPLLCKELGVSEYDFYNKKQECSFLEDTYYDFIEAILDEIDLDKEWGEYSEHWDYLHENGICHFIFKKPAEQHIKESEWEEKEIEGEIIEGQKLEEWNKQAIRAIYKVFQEHNIVYMEYDELPQSLFVKTKIV